MSWKNFDFKKILLFLFSLNFLFLSHCLRPNYNSVLLFPSVGENTSLSDSDYFYFDLNESHYDSLGVDPPLYEISTTTSYGDAQERDSVSNCEILYDPRDENDPESSSSETKICVLDIMENDLVVNDLKLIYNIPEKMCRYIEVLPAWHYNYKTAQGPTKVATCDPPDAASAEEESEEESYYCTEDLNASGVSLPTGYTCKNSTIAPESIIAKCAIEVEDLCSYNYIGPDGNDISCCYGTYTNVSDANEAEWAGSDNLQECLGGPGRTSWDFLTTDGFPAILTQSVPEHGIKGSFEIKNLLDVTSTKAFSTPIANYLEELDQDPDDLRDVSRNTLPEFLQYPTFTTQVIAGSMPNPFFYVSCLDGAGEVLHKLQLMIREWNTHEEFIDFYLTGGSEDADPDIAGIEGEDCAYEDRATLKNEDGQCNDSLDLDDIDKAKGNILNFLPSLDLSSGQRDALKRVIGFPGAPYNAGGGSSGSSDNN